MCTVLSHKFGVVQAHRTSLNPLKQDISTSLYVTSPTDSLEVAFSGSRVAKATLEDISLYRMMVVTFLFSGSPGVFAN